MSKLEKLLLASCQQNIHQDIAWRLSSDDFA
jgi:hypothetical protein